MFTFGTRRVQENRYTHWVTLPPQWLINMGVGKGDELLIEMDEHKRLVMTPVKILEGVT